MKSAAVSIPGAKRSRYPIVAKHGALQTIADQVKKLAPVDRVVVLYDTGVKHIADEIVTHLPEATQIAVPSGEESKSLQQVERIVQDLLMKNATRQTVLINVGGGMLTDLGGFIACVFRRGIRYINVPTNLMGMTDAAIGGHSAVNIGSVKNILGTNTHPAAVIVDLDVLADAPERSLSEGLVEVVKMAAMFDSEFFGWLEENLEKILNREKQAFDVCIEHAVRLKTTALSKDPTEDNVQLLLHFGHTVGHAVEALSRFELSHGQAVSIGMIVEMQMTSGTAADLQRITQLMETLNMPTTIPLQIKNAALWEVMRKDKKTVEDTVRVAVPKPLGTGKLLPVTYEDFTAARDA